MDPEHRLLKFIVVPLLIAVLAYLCSGLFTGDPVSKYVPIGYNFELGGWKGSTEPLDSNIAKYSLFVGEQTKSRGVVTVCTNDGKFSTFGLTEPDRKNTQFRVASVTKIFTSIAVMKLADEDRINLGDDVSKYVNYRKQFDKTPTVLDLILHTAGFDNNNVGFFYKMNEHKPSLHDFVNRKPIVQAIEPHTVIDYTNIAFDIAGLVVEQASGMDFERYCQENIFKPLDMNDTTFTEPETLVEGKDSHGNIVENYKVCGIPSGGLITTSEDMGHFLRCLMSGGEYNNHQIFSERLMKELYEPKFDMKPLDLVRTPVFWINDFDGNKSFSQLGMMLGFSSGLIIIPDKVAVFTATADQALGQRLGYSVLRTFYPSQVSEEPAKPETKKEPMKIINPDDYTGSWINMFGWNRNSFAKIANAVAFNLKITATQDRLMINQTPVEKEDEFNFNSDWWRVKFVKGESGRIKYLQTGQDAHIKAPWYMSSKFVIVFIAAVMAINLTIVLNWLFGLALKLMRKERQPKTDVVVRLSTLCISILNIGFVVTGIVVIVGMDIYYLGFRPGIPFYLLFSLPIISTILTPIVVWGAVRAWFLKGWQTTSRLMLTIFAIVQLTFIWFLVFWNLLGFNF